MTKIIIADDHSIVRQGLKLILDDIPDLEVTGEAETGDELLEKLNKNHYDIALLDIGMPGRDVIDTLREIKIHKPELKVLILSMNPEKLFGVRLIKSGAYGYISKDSHPDELIKAIQTVANGKKYISSQLSELLSDEFIEHKNKLEHELLTDREFQIMHLIIEGKSLTEIANTLFISKNTVSNHRNNILKKLNVKNNIEITHYALKHKLIKD